MFGHIGYVAIKNNILSVIILSVVELSVAAPQYNKCLVVGYGCKSVLLDGPPKYLTTIETDDLSTTSITTIILNGQYAI
jgi:hypothetical protein